MAKVLFFWPLGDGTPSLTYNEPYKVDMADMLANSCPFIHPADAAQH